MFSLVNAVKALSVALVLASVAYFSYDYGVTKNEQKHIAAENALIATIAERDATARKLAQKLANQKPVIEYRYKTIEKKVIKYVEQNSDKHCIVDDAMWLSVRADAVREHNAAIGVQSAATVSNDTAATTASDGQVLAEDVSNIKTCARTAKRLLDLQTWIKSQIKP